MLEGIWLPICLFVYLFICLFYLFIFSRTEVTKILMSHIDPKDVEIKPDGLIYLPEIRYRRILNRAFGILFYFFSFFFFFHSSHFFSPQFFSSYSFSFLVLHVLGARFSIKDYWQFVFNWPNKKLSHNSFSLRTFSINTSCYFTSSFPPSLSHN